MPPLIQVQTIPIFNDNYVFVIHDKKEAYVVDPGSSEEVNQFLSEKNLNLIGILNTHHHLDHIGGNNALKTKWNCKIYASALDKNRIPNIDISLSDSESLNLLGHKAKVLFTPGHTFSHISYYFPNDNLLFCGDTLFSNGCGRVFDGTIEELFNSFKKFKELAPCTKIYCAHEYTLDNTNFALTVDSENKNLIKMKQDVENLRGNKISTIPTTIAHELLTNPFFRCDNSYISQHLGLEPKTEFQTFKKLRLLKDSF